jgi:hypothetical protein
MEWEQAVRRLNKGTKDSHARIAVFGNQETDIKSQNESFENDLNEFLAFPLRTFRGQHYRDVHKAYFEWDETLAAERKMREDNHSWVKKAQ